MLGEGFIRAFKYRDREDIKDMAPTRPYRSPPCRDPTGETRLDSTAVRMIKGGE